MIRFTSRGAVATPLTLQIRVGVDPGALRAGAPVPSRALTPLEILQNIEHFTTGLHTPRTQPCTRLVLSGVTGHPPMNEAMAFARSHGVQKIVIHGLADPSTLEASDSVAIRWERVPIAPSVDCDWTAVVPLEVGALADPQTLMEAVHRFRPSRVVFAWPFPGVQPMPVEEAVVLATALVSQLEDVGIEAALRGLPPCLSGTGEGRTRNRYYVDAEHQEANALLFWPDVVQFLKPEACRTCSKTVVCDGVAAKWLEGGVVSEVRPIP